MVRWNGLQCVGVQCWRVGMICFAMAGQKTKKVRQTGFPYQADQKQTWAY